MSKFIVVVFDTENAAYEGSQAVLQLDREGNIALHAGAVIDKDLSGQVAVKNGIDEGPIGTAAGQSNGRTRWADHS